MIEGPLTGATDSDAASAAEVTALAAAVAGNTASLGTKAAAAVSAADDSPPCVHLQVRKLIFENVSVIYHANYMSR